MAAALADEFDALVDFNGELLPPIEGPLGRMFDNYFAMRYGFDREGRDPLGPGTNWSDWEAHVNRMIAGLDGTLYAVPYELANGRQWVHWLEHDHFHLNT